MSRTNTTRLRDYIMALDEFTLLEEVPSGHDHMGALLVDAALQAGIRYETVVRPRVAAILQGHPEAKTTSAFQRVLMIEGAANLLKWRLGRKINTLVDLTQFLVAERVETIDDLRAWLHEGGKVARLKQIKGTGDKTADLLKMKPASPQAPSTAIATTSSPRPASPCVATRKRSLSSAGRPSYWTAMSAPSTTASGATWRANCSPVEGQHGHGPDRSFPV